LKNKDYKLYDEPIVDENGNLCKGEAYWKVQGLIEITNYDDAMNKIRELDSVLDSINTKIKSLRQLCANLNDLDQDLININSGKSLYIEDT